MGQLLLGSVLDSVKPCKVVATSDDVELPSMAWPTKKIHLDLPIVRLHPLNGLFVRDPYTKQVTLAKIRRETTIGYFGGLKLLTKKAIVVPWHVIALHEVSGPVPPEQCLHLMNANVVALCRVSDKLICEHEADPTLPRLLRGCDDAGAEPMECLGFAFVRNIDMMRKCFHLVTPETDEVVHSANALVHCVGESVTDVFDTNQGGDEKMDIDS